MDIQQEQMAKSMDDGHRVIHGVAGSGKTLILGYRCLHLAHATNKPILVLCFNITLAAHLRSFIAAKGIEAKVQVYHFHDWCNLQLKTYNVDTLPGDNPIWERQVQSVIDAVNKDQIPRAQYGALMIDEGHVPLIEPEVAGANGPEPVVRQFGSNKDEATYIARCIKKWQQAGQALNTIAVIYTQHWQGASLL